MAYIATITKHSIARLTDVDYQVMIHVKIMDGIVVVFEKDYSKRYYSQLDIRTIEQKLQKQINADWDQYIKEQEFFKTSEFDNMVSEIQSTTDSYINKKEVK